MTYYEKLRDPKWQKKRLELMSARNWTCEKCSSTDKTLSIHHLVYRPKTDPWDYYDYEYLCLCEDCHYEAEKQKIDFLQTLAFVGFHDFPSLATAILRAIKATNKAGVEGFLECANHEDLMLEAAKRMKRDVQKEFEEPLKIISAK